MHVALPRLARDRRLTLVELLVAIAIMMTLAALSIPMFRDMQLDAQLVETEVLTEGLLDAAAAYASETGAAHPGTGLAALHPPTQGRSVQPWVAAPDPFAEIAWRPDGGVRCGYAFSGLDLFVQALGRCDLDLDRDYAILRRAWEIAEGGSREAQKACYDALRNRTYVGPNPQCH